ncbi:NDP-hexose 2,3-dehydratase family protein [Streptomyces sp. AK010]|uniref:NDP-hexose 2,3-dehydratase family protein n=1 Tax=Streptomyces sp. AK010 TaxID=2723074 RepID=UPI00161E5EF8|nr:NDP-hexose 2,3-dehydratase family protein [Streptomyces sp. AK010]MBB6421367.1 oxidase EvaA [Streptomyces sp. AK010]
MTQILHASIDAPAVGDGPLTSAAGFHAWWADRHRAGRHRVEQVGLADLKDWAFDPRTGNLGHSSGRFFSVEGLEVREGSTVTWQQPIINQPEIGILGIVVKAFDGVLHCLMQAKMEPGNVNVLQLSPTVQATRSNYTQVHCGDRTPYLEYFAGPGRGEVLVDVLQSEQGAWFWRKRNRNMVVLVTGDVPVHENYCWLSLAQVRALTRVDNLVNMDARTVLSCMPFAFPQEAEADGRDPFRDALIRSYQYEAGEPGLHGRHSAGEILSWFIEAKTRCEWSARLVPLGEVSGWSHDRRELSDEDRRQFRVIGVSVEAGDREVKRWTQPLLAPRGQGRAMFLVRVLDGVLHLLVQARPEYGLMDMVEMAPTVHLLPGEDLAGIRDVRLREAVSDPAAHGHTVRYDTVQSEEGGRFHHALTRYQVIETGPDFPDEAPPGHLWVTVRQLTDLLRHGHYLNIEARSLLAGLHSLC